MNDSWEGVGVAVAGEALGTTRVDDVGAEVGDGEIGGLPHPTRRTTVIRNAVKARPSVPRR